MPFKEWLMAEWGAEYEDYLLMPYEDRCIINDDYIRYRSELMFNEAFS